MHSDNSLRKGYYNSVTKFGKKGKGVVSYQ